MGGLLQFWKRPWPRLTVARVTARFQRMIDDLERVERLSCAGAEAHKRQIERHKAKQAAHEQEAQAARNVGVKIRDLINTGPGPVIQA